MFNRKCRQILSLTLIIITMTSLLTFPVLAVETPEIRVIENNNNVVAPAQITCCSSMNVGLVLVAVACVRNATTRRCYRHIRTYNRICTWCRTNHGGHVRFVTAPGCNRIM